MMAIAYYFLGGGKMPGLRVRCPRVSCVRQTMVEEGREMSDLRE